MVAVEISFLAGRFHATPWGRHVNEGIPEWPPSPWRLLRALVADWYKDSPEESKGLFVALLAKLAVLPSFHLPPATVGSSQHYMPQGKDRRLVFDTFVNVDRNTPLYIIWPDIVLDDAESILLSKLLSSMTYFGRAESWADARLAEDFPEPNCHPSDSSQGEEVRVLAAESGPDLLAHLCYDTQEKRRAGILDPEGSKWVNYVRPLDAFAPKFQTRPIPYRPVKIVRFALHGKPLPRLQDTIALGELTRASVMAKFGRMNEGNVSPALSGKDKEGHPLDNHTHAFYLPTDENKDGFLDHITVYVPRGLEEAEFHAITSLRSLNPGNNKPEYGLFLLGTSLTEDVNALAFSKSPEWQSVTPFILGRFPKYYRTGKPKLRENGVQIDGPVDQIYREWNLRRRIQPELPELVSVELVDKATLLGKWVSWASFRMWRQRGRGTNTPGLAYGFRLQFSSAVSGPIALGYGSHFGLGLFFPQEDSGAIENE